MVMPHAHLAGLPALHPSPRDGKNYVGIVILHAGLTALGQNSSPRRRSHLALLVMVHARVVPESAWIVMVGACTTCALRRSCPDCSRIVMSRAARAPHCVAIVRSDAALERLSDVFRAFLPPYYWHGRPQTPDGAWLSDSDSGCLHW
jgi:hypothetical protein